MEDAIMASESTSILTSSPKRHKASSTTALLVDTDMKIEATNSSHCLDADQSTRFEQLSIDASKLPPSTSSESSAGQDRNLFLTLSTSPINHDVDATPVSKNTKGQQAKAKKDPPLKPASIFKPKGSAAKAQPKIDTCTSDQSRPTDTPTPPVHRELGSSMTDEHSMLNRHLRNQSFTPLPHLSTSNECSVGSGTSPSGAAFAAAIAPQLSWSIAGDTPSLGDLAEWDEDNQKLTSVMRTQSKDSAVDNRKIQPSSTSSSSSGTRSNMMMISPHEFSFWKEDHDMDMIVSTGAAAASNSGTTTPLPIFFDQSNESTENNHQQMQRFNQQGKKSTGMNDDDHHHGHPHHPPHQNPPPHHPMFRANGVGGPNGLKPSNSKPMPPPQVWSKHHDPSAADKMGMGMPPTPMFAASEFRDEGFGPRSPMGADRRDGGPGMEYYPYPHPPPPHGGPNDRVRNLRGRVPPGAHMPPMPLHIPPPMSAHLPMTSPMGLGPKAGLWSPHHMPPQIASPHHMGSPLGNMAQSKRKCVPLKPPIPSKFQGDIEKAKSAQVPEFTSLVNFPGHMSQKQSVNLPEGMRCCVMCGQACPCSTGNKNKKGKKNNDGSLAPRNNNAPDPHHPHHHPHPAQQQQQHLGDKNSGYAIIPTQNKGLCTLCDVNVWVVVASGLEIKWCKGCKNFRPWAAFGDKGLATKCLRCRERQREKYALQKEEKEKARLNAKAKK